MVMTNLGLDLPLDLPYISPWNAPTSVMDGPGLVGPRPTGPTEIDRDRDRPRTDRSVSVLEFGKPVGPRSVLNRFQKFRSVLS